ncbi:MULTISPECIES: BPSS1780 family membrane protein [unclassified Pseudoalteromonas]|uniref:BPSS1780 family membrane protein n=1 Tax=unclassified Pseudoalteromonas TaxID=194690 RepID=UPI0020983970|nr:BPSS1780 family membrane protein [Pseudoalteromonas sp. XMcav2-N]MCO7189717.1 hypothetical protein [Pseudoalteromonas sp. XMcav2-N]
MPTEFKTFTAGFGLQWLKAGWIIFKSQPVTFVMMHLLMVVVSLVPFVFPPLQLVAVLASPFLTAGFYLAVVKKQQGQVITLADILAPFSTKGRRLNLFRFGLYQMGMALLLSALLSVLFGPALEMLQSVDEQSEQADVFAQVLAQITFADVAIFVVVQSVAMMAFAYALPLVFFRGEVSIIQAMKQSLTVFYRNMAPLTVFGALVAMLMLLCIPMSLVPLIVVMPIAYIGFFVSFQAIVSTSEPPAPTDDASSQSQTQSGRFDA